MPDLPVILEAQPGQILTLGRAGESDKICYTFNLDPWFKSREFTNGDSLQLIYMIGGPVAKLVETFTYDSSLNRFDPAAPYNYDQYPIYKSDRDPQWQLYWPITSDLTNAPGAGTLQVKFSSKNGNVYETILYQTMVSRSVITLGTLTEQEKSTYSQWLAALQRAIAESAGLNISSTTIGPFEDPYVVKGTNQETQEPILNFNLPASRPTFRRIYPALIEGSNSLFNNANSSQVEVGDYFLVSKESDNQDYRGLFYERVADHIDQGYVTTGGSPRITTDTLPASPTERKLYIAVNENGISSQDPAFSCDQWDIISYHDSAWHIVYKCIIDMSIIGPQGPQGLNINSISIDPVQGSDQYVLTYTTTDPAQPSQQPQSHTISGQAFYNFLNSAVQSTSDNVDAAQKWAEGSNTSTDPQYNNSAKDWATTANQSASNASNSAAQVENTSATASVTSTVGTPSVVVTKTIVGEDPNSHINLDFAFNNLKGDTGSAVNIKGQVATAGDIPSGTYNNGDGYFVGTIAPYDLYIYYSNQWNNNGPLGGVTIQLDTNTHSIKFNI